MKIINSGKLILFFLICIALGYAIGTNFISVTSQSHSSRNTKISGDKKERNPVLIEDNHRLKLIRENGSKIESILTSNNKIQEAQLLDFKALVVEINATQTSHELNYYYFRSLHEDTNNNQFQDEGDLGFFNPASTVKVAIAALTLEKLNGLNLTRAVEYRIAGTAQWYSVAEDIKQALVISDNAATNRLILFLGFDFIAHRMKSLGIKSYGVNRLMLNQGTLINSPIFDLRDQGQITQTTPEEVTHRANCLEAKNTIGNCANARDLADILMRLIQPELYSPEQRFEVRGEERLWMQDLMAKTPQEQGFNQEDTFCRFLDPLGKKIANSNGRLLSKCGVGLFAPYNLVDTSFMATDDQQQYYLVMVLSPTAQMSRAEAINWLNHVSVLILSGL